MTADVPRRLPRTQGQRVQNVARTHAAQSLGGATAAARPVQNTTPTPTIYKPPTGGLTQDRLIVTTDITGLSGSGYQDVTSWDSTNVTVGTSVTLGSPDDGGVYLNTAGVYAVTARLVSAVHTVATDMFIAVIMDCPQLWTTPVASLRGGDGAPGWTDAATSSTTQWCAGGGAAIYPTVIYRTLDASVTAVTVRLCVQRIT